jgi:hypothetical protein
MIAYVRVTCKRSFLKQVFQCLIIDGENVGEDALRNAENFVVTDEEFQQFLERHKSVKQLVPESNEAMRYSYLILDEYVRICFASILIIFRHAFAHACFQHC